MVNFTSGLDGKLWKEEQKKKISAAKNRLRSRRATKVETRGQQMGT